MDINKKKIYISFLFLCFVSIIYSQTRPTSQSSLDRSKNKKESNIYISKEETEITPVHNATSPEGATDVGEKSPTTLEEEQILKSIIGEELDAILEKALKQLQKIDLVLEDLALVVQNGLVKTSNKAELLSQIKSLRLNINIIKENRIVKQPQFDVATVYSIAILNSALTEHIQMAINSGLKKLIPFDPADIEVRAIPISLEQIVSIIDDNEKKCEALNNSAKQVGLTWYNKAYRFLVNRNKTAQKYSLWSRSLKVTTGGLLVAYLLYRFTSYGKKFGLGEPPQFDAQTRTTIINSEQVGILGTIESQLAMWSLGMLPIGNYLLNNTRSFINEEWKKLKLISSRYADLIHNKLLGGIEAKKAQAEYDSDKPRITFDDVIGLGYIKSDLRVLIKYLENPAGFERANIVPEKGYIFTGPPGTGKSFMAEALGGEIRKMLERTGRDKDEFKFFKLDAELISREGIDRILYLAQSEAPCIIFIDEIDLLGLQRTQDRAKLSKFLEAMSGYLSNNYRKQVILIAATNSPQNLDVALLRFGRFGKKYHFRYPTLSDRKEYLQRKLNSIVANINDFDIDKIARETEGQSPEALKAIVRNAFQKTKIKSEPLTYQDLENALNEEVRHVIYDDNFKVSEHELRVIASQQAACALTSVLLNPSQKLAWVTINPTMNHIEEQNVWDRYYAKKEREIQYGRIFTYHDQDTLSIATREDQISHCKINLAGQFGEELILGSSGYSYNTESTQMAYNIALAIVSEGLNLTKMTKKIQDEYHDKAMQLFNKCKDEVKQLLQKNILHLKNVYELLLKYRSLDSAQLNKIIQNDLSE